MKCSDALGRVGGGELNYIAASGYGLEKAVTKLSHVVEKKEKLMGMVSVDEPQKQKIERKTRRERKRKLFRHLLLQPPY